MRETHVPLESVWERSDRAVEEGSKRPSKFIKGPKLRRTSNLTFSKTSLKLHTKKTAIVFVLENKEILEIEFIFLFVILFYFVFDCG